MIKEEMTPNPGTGNSVGLLGDYLKQKRLDKNYSLEKLSQKTKISVNILKCLEANDFEHLPSAAYIKGFVTSYVKVLGLPLEEAINKMEYTYLNVLGKPFPALNHTKSMPAANISVTRPQSTAQSEESTQNSPHEVIESGESIIESTKSILPLAILSAVILLFIGGYKLVSSIVENEVSSQKGQDLGPKIESSSALVNVNEKRATPPVAEKTTEPVPTVTEPEANPAATTATEATPPVPTVPEVKKEPEVSTVSPVTAVERNYPNIEFKKIKGKLFNVMTDAPENDDQSLLPDNIKAQVKSDLQNVYIRAVGGNTWLSYKIDNRPISSVIIEKGKDLFLQGNDIRLFLGNVGVTKIFYNNYLIDTPTKSGVKSLIFPEENNEKYVMPLFPKAKDDILYTAEEYQKRMKLEEDELAKRPE